MPTYKELMHILSEDFGQRITKKRIINAVEEAGVIVHKSKPGRGSVGGRPQRAIDIDDVDRVRQIIDKNMMVSLRKSSALICALHGEGFNDYGIADAVGVSAALVKAWSYEDRHMRKSYYDILSELLEGLK